MSDYFSPHSPEDDALPSFPASLIVFASMASAACPQGRVPIAHDELANALPCLGTVLWLERSDCATSARWRADARQGAPAYDHPACALLARCQMASAHSTVTSQGPREWLCFFGGDGEPLAKIFLLPDSDYLAWDHMAYALQLAPSVVADCEPPTHATLLNRALARFGQRRQARLLAFDLQSRQSTCTLGARAPLRISLLGLDLARGIVSDEGADWISPLHTG
ncbi:MAG: hypothetical protein ABI650_02010 [Dokdonella sp.]